MRVALLDLNYTLVSQSGLPWKGWDWRKKHEQYRGWLVEIIRRLEFDAVVLITVRTVEHEEWTLRRISEQLDGWQPDFAVFNYTGLSDPPSAKLRAMNEVVIPKYGVPEETTYVAFESNAHTHKMYWEHFGIVGFKAMPACEASRRDAPAASRSRVQPRLF